MWTELFGSKAFKHKNELHKALKRCVSAGLVQSVKTNGPHIFSITPKGEKFLETFAHDWRVFKVRKRIRRPLIF
jgi:predicted transcriptional regulator